MSNVFSHRPTHSLHLELNSTMAFSIIISQTWNLCKLDVLVRQRRKNIEHEQMRKALHLLCVANCLLHGMYTYMFAINALPFVIRAKSDIVR